MMERGMMFLNELLKMKEEMDRTWNNLFIGTPNGKGEESWQWVERLPKFEGVGRRSSNSRSNKTIKY